MDLEFVQIEHRQNILKLMEVCGLEMKQAYDLYVNSGYNFEAAVSRQFNNVPQNAFHANNAPPQANYYQPQPPFYENQYHEDDGDYKYIQYKQFIKNGPSFDQKYPVRKHESFFERIIPSFFKKETQDPFKSKLDKYIQKRSKLKNTVGNLSEILEWSWKQKYPALIMILDFSPANKQSIKKIFSQDVFVELVLNQQFKLYGISAFEYDLEEQLKRHFNLERDVNHFVVCRVNHLEEVEVMHRIKVTQPYEQIKKKLKLVKSQCIQLEMEEGNIIKQYQEEKRGNYNYRRPRTIKQNLKFKEDKKIRKQQQQQFYKACLPKKEQQKPAKEQQPPKIQEKIQKQQVKPEIPKKKQEQVSQQVIKRNREQKFSRLPKYSNGLTFKIRVPSGQNIIVSVNGQEMVQYLFDYIAYEPNDLGFANDISRQFDINVGFGGSQTLKGKEKQQLKSLFEHSEVLIVRQTTE